MIKPLLIKPFAKSIAKGVDKIRANAVADQHRIMLELVRKASNTEFGKLHQFSTIRDYNSFTTSIPVADYEQGKSYFDAIVLGKPNVLWPGKPKYLAKTSGTTSGVKYIPITPDSLPNHLLTARMALMNYASQGDHSRLFNGKVMFLSGSPTLSKTGGIDTGRLSGIVNHEIPAWIKGNQLPSFKTNCIEDWEEKLDQIVRETISSDLRLISGIPPWVQMYFERVLSITGKSTILDVFPQLQLFMYGGVNYAPYRDSIESLIGAQIDSLETYPASEGFIAFQDSRLEDGLLLNTNSGIFFEFVPLDEIHQEKPMRLKLDEVQKDVDYALIINNNAGLWAYNIGDTVRFVSLNPYRIIVSGRVKHFISAFGEHVISKEVEEAVLHACKSQGAKIREFTVAPQVNPKDQHIPYHEWFFEFDQKPKELKSFAKDIDQSMRHQNIYYDDLVRGGILSPLVIRVLKKNAFRDFMKLQGKLGGQNKVPRLSNDRKIADLFYTENLIQTDSQG